MADAEGQAYMAQTDASLQTINGELGLLRTDQDTTTAIVVGITRDVAAFKQLRI